MVVSAVVEGVAVEDVVGAVAVVVVVAAAAD